MGTYKSIASRIWAEAYSDITPEIVPGALTDPNLAVKNPVLMITSPGPQGLQSSHKLKSAIPEQFGRRTGDIEAQYVRFTPNSGHTRVGVKESAFDPRQTSENKSIQLICVAVEVDEYSRNPNAQPQSPLPLFLRSKASFHLTNQGTGRYSYCSTGARTGLLE